VAFFYLFFVILPPRLRSVLLHKSSCNIPPSSSRPSDHLYCSYNSVGKRRKIYKGWNFGVFETPEKNERIGERERERGGKSYMGDDEEKKGKQQQQQHQGGWLYRRRIA
jgi:hypothetical protein